MKSCRFYAGCSTSTATSKFGIRFSLWLVRTSIGPAARSWAARDWIIGKSLYWEQCDQLDAALAQLAGDEVVVKQRVGDDHVAGRQRVIHLPQQRGLSGALARVRRDGQVVAGASSQREQHGKPGQREADPRLLHFRLRVARLVLLRVRHGDVGAVDNEHRPPVPLPLLGRASL